MKDRWSQLSMSEKSDLMSLYIKNGISSLEEIKKHYNSFQAGGHLYQTGGPDDDKYSFLRREPEVAVADNTRYVKPITDADIDVIEGLPKGTTTLRRTIAANASRPQATIQAAVTPEETQKQINKAVKIQKALEPVNKVLDAVEYVPVLGDAVTVGRTAFDATQGDYTTASLLPLMWLGNKIPLGKAGVKQATKTAGVTLKRKVTTDPFVELLQQKTGRTITRVPIKQTRLSDIYSDGFSFVDDSGKEIAHIAGNRNRDNAVFVESSFMAPELRRRGLGKKMYFDFNNQTFDRYGTTLHSSPYQHQLTLETEPGSGVFISPSSNLWRGLKKNGLATMGGSGLDKYYVMASPVDEAYKKASRISINYSDELKKFIENNRDRIDTERALGHLNNSDDVENALQYYKNNFDINLTREEANDLLTARYLNLRDATSRLSDNQRLGIVHNNNEGYGFNLFNNSNEEIGYIMTHKQPSERDKYYVSGIGNKSTSIKDKDGNIIGHKERKVARDLYDMFLDVVQKPLITGQDLLSPQATMKTILKDGYTRELRPDLRHEWFGDVMIDGKKIEPMASEITSHAPRTTSNVAKSLLFEPYIIDNGVMNIDLLGGLYRAYGGHLKQ